MRAKFFSLYIHLGLSDEVQELPLQSVHRQRIDRCELRALDKQHTQREAFSKCTIRVCSQATKRNAVPPRSPISRKSTADKASQEARHPDKLCYMLSSSLPRIHVSFLQSMTIPEFAYICSPFFSLKTIYTARFFFWLFTFLFCDVLCV